MLLLTGHLSCIREVIHTSCEGGISLRRILQPILLSTLITFALAGTALADSSGFGARALGMGGAFTAVADDGTAAYWNPAGLAQVKVFGITPSLGVQGDWQKALDAYHMAQQNQRPSLDGVQAAFDGMVGLNLKSFGLNMMTQSDLNADQNASTTVAVGNGSAAFSLSTAREFTPLLALGTNIKLLRNEYYKFDTDSLAPNDPSLNYRDQASAEGLAVDVGAQLKLGKALRAGIVARNIGSYLKFKGTRKSYVDSTETPISFSQQLPTSLVAGVAMEPLLVPGLMVAGDLEHFTGTGENQLHLGVEQTLKSIFKIRAGVIKSDATDRLEYSAGAGIQAGPASVDLAALGNTDEGVNRIYLSAGFVW